MESESQTKEITVTFRGKKYRYPVEPGTSVKNIVDRLQQDTGVPYQNQKLLARGKQIDLEALLEENAGTLPAKIKLLGSTNTEIQQVVDTHEKLNNKVRIKDDLNPIRRRRPRNQIVKREIPDYRFERIQVLKGLPEQEKAREILTRLSEDTGFLAVLKKHKWNVGLLSEMYPQGQVGVSEVCVLGVNKNKGQEISLRIRTDDLKGFRKYLSIKEVLCHELAHMVHSEHDSKFYVLMREIQRDIIALDWKQQPGKRLGGAGADVGRAQVEYYDDEDEKQPTQFQLGGAPNKYGNLTPAEKARLAAEERAASAARKQAEGKNQNSGHSSNRSD
mmetsp:Transcript_5155/g.6237  ORF Transcript_5155/g.6237 Transcript_5155/m.6237 type:complete len:332 (-) Transcript_5155:124-1119(-)